MNLSLKTKRVFCLLCITVSALCFWITAYFWIVPLNMTGMAIIYQNNYFDYLLGKFVALIEIFV